MQISSIHSLVDFYEMTLSFHEFFVEISNQFLKPLVTKRVFQKNEDYRECLDALSYIINKEGINRSKTIKNKKFGQYYTKKSVCRFINERVLDNFDFEISKSPSILDPSCGFGYFLIDMIFLLLKKAQSDENLYPSDASIFEFVRIILENQIIGFDIDKFSIKITRYLLLSLIVVLYHITNTRDSKEKFDIQYNLARMKNIIFRNVKYQNFLTINKSEKTKKYHIIIGNPPYIRIHKIDPHLNRYLRKNFYTAHKDFDIYVIFFEQSLNLLCKGGIIGFITPEKYFQRAYAEKLRKLILINSIIMEIIDISRCEDIFFADIYPCITILNKLHCNLKIPEQPFATNQINFRDIDNKFIIYVRMEQNFDVQWQSLSNLMRDLRTCKKNDEVIEYDYKIIEYKEFINQVSSINFTYEFSTVEIVGNLDQIFQNYISLEDITDKKGIYCGTPRAKNYKLLKNAIYDSILPKYPEDLKYIVSRNIFPFGIYWGIKINSAKSKYQFPHILLKKGPYSKNLIDKFKKIPKILVKANSIRITAAMDNFGYVFNGVYGIYLHREKIHSINNLDLIDEKVITCILNSDLINFYIQKKFKSYMLRSQYLSINSNILMTIPIPIYKNLDKPTSKMNKNLKVGDFYLKINKLKQLSDSMECNLNVFYNDFLMKNRFELKFTNKILGDIKKSQLRVEIIQNLFDEAILDESDLKIFNELRNYEKNLAEMNCIIFSLFNIPEEMVRKIKFSLFIR